MESGHSPSLSNAGSWPACESFACPPARRSTWKSGPFRKGLRPSRTQSRSPDRQIPLPGHIDEAAVISAIDPNKDLDGFHVVNAGRLAAGQPGLVPCTPLGCLWLLKEELGDLSGRTAVIVGRSNIVGKPMAQLLLAENCTVTIAHSRTSNLPDVVRSADIVVAAVGRAEMIKQDWIKPGASVIDVGINRFSTDTPGKPGSLVMWKQL